MPKIAIYTKPFCGYCARAKSLLKKKGAAFEDIDVFMDSDARNEMERRAGGRRTVPQIFIGDRHIGGWDELDELKESGDLDRLLESG